MPMSACAWHVNLALRVRTNNSRHRPKKTLDNSAGSEPTTSELIDFQIWITFALLTELQGQMRASCELFQSAVVIYRETVI